jgi:hypothetical protein
MSDPFDRLTCKSDAVSHLFEKGNVVLRDTRVFSDEVYVISHMLGRLTNPRGTVVYLAYELQVNPNEVTSDLDVRQAASESATILCPTDP